MRASRLLSILLLLQTRGRMSAEALASEVEASVRTVFRDVDQLSASGIPIWAERGRNGGFQLKEGWRTKLTGLTTEEARAIFLAGLPGPAAELGLGEAMTSAQLKLLAALHRLPIYVEPHGDPALADSAAGQPRAGDVPACDQPLAAAAVSVALRVRAGVADMYHRPALRTTPRGSTSLSDSRFQLR